MRQRSSFAVAAAAIALALVAASALRPSVASAQPVAPRPAPAASPSYADLADLADSAPLVVRAQLRGLTALEPERARGVRAGWARYYVEARTRALIAGNAAQGESLRFLADLPLDARGRPPRLKGKDVLLFAREAPGRPGELQLVAPDALLAWDAAVEGRVRAVLQEFNAADRPARVTGVREAIFVPGTLAGEGETQIFLATHDETAASITVTHKPGAEPHWGVSFSEVFDPAARPPARDTLAWYRLACFLPRQLAPRVNVSATFEDQGQALRDYELVLRGLGDCERTRQ